MAVDLHPEASYLCYSILAKHPILHVAPLKAFPFLCFYDSILFPSFLVFWNVFCPLSMSEFMTVTFVMLSHHSVVFNSVTFSLLAHQCMSVYTPHSLPIMLCHHLCIPMLVCLSFVVIKSVRSQHNHRRPHYMRVPSEYVCLVEFGYHFEMPVFGKPEMPLLLWNKVCVWHLNMVVWYLDVTYEHLYVGNSDGNCVFSCFRTSDVTKSGSQDNLDEKASEKVNFSLLKTKKKY